MSDYTATTEEVRNAFSLMEDDASTQENLQNFDRWLESTLQETQIAERERIIKLLEKDCHSYDGKVQCPCGAITPEQVGYVVALIEGENK